MNGVKRSQVGVQTQQYETEHGHAPRGRGQWAFTFGQHNTVPVFCPLGPVLYGAAKAWAIAEAVSRGCYDVGVCD